MPPSYSGSSTHGDEYKTAVGKPDGKRPPVKLRHKWKHNVNMNFKEQGVKVWTGFI
jgi:hypothetical protein